MTGRPYIGRFAPSPTGHLHLGSMVAALASWLDAKAHGGQWLVRMEDLDPPREVEGAADDILRTLERFGLTWDGSVVYQSERHGHYREALDGLLARDEAFGCACTRKSLAQINGLGVYPGVCRDGLSPGQVPRSWRFRMPEGPSLSWDDRMQGRQSFDRRDVGDVTLLRADGYWAYHLAVVVDDAAQDVSHVVRGADLVESTAAHLAIQEVLGLKRPRYAHVDVVLNDQGQKLSKQTLASPVRTERASEVLSECLTHLGLDGIGTDRPSLMLEKATEAWTQVHLSRSGS